MLVQLEAVEEEAEGLQEVPSELVPAPLPRPSPLLAQWAWRPTTCPLEEEEDKEEQLSAQHWMGPPPPVGSRMDQAVAGQ